MMNIYLQKTALLLKSIPNIVPLDTGTPVVIYGAGNVGRKARHILQESGYSVLGFLDQNPKSTFIEELPCVLSNSESASEWCDRNATVIIAVMNPDADTRDINHSLSHFPWNRAVSFPQLVELFHEQWNDHYWITHRDFYKDANVREGILQAAELWEDQVSRDCFTTILEARLNGRTDELDNLVREYQQTQYFPKDIPGWPSPTNFVDCGAFDGDTLRQIPMEELQSIAAFEPDIENFHALSISTQSTPQFAESDIQVLLWPCGVWNETTTLRFNAEQTPSSHLDENGTEAIQVVALDDVLQNAAPNFIKMDVEGAELEALLGAQAIIKKYHPALAICVYHKPNHLWKIVQLIVSWQCGYKFYLRTHQLSGLDVVLYANPRK